MTIRYQSLTLDALVVETDLTTVRFAGAADTWLSLETRGAA